MTDLCMGSHLNEEPTSGTVQLNFEEFPDARSLDQWWNDLLLVPERKFDENSPDAQEVDRWWSHLIFELSLFGENRMDGSVQRFLSYNEK